MSIITDTVVNNRYEKDSARIKTANKDGKGKITDTLSSYLPSDAEREARNSFLKDFRLGWQTMHLPRMELNDLSLYQRHVVDMLAFNTYQENDGQSLLEDRLGGWRSKAVRPVIRNKAISITAHRTARLLAPKVFSYDGRNEEQEEAAKVMGYLLDWAREQAGYNRTAIDRDIQAIYSPISWGYTEYAMVYRNIKDKKVDGRWTYKQVIDDNESGHIHIPISTEHVFFPNFYEKDPQKQDFIILRRIISYEQAKAKYGHLSNFNYVHAGVIVTMDDANQGFYDTYDPHMRIEEVEELIRWKKSTDSKEVMINGVMLSEPEEANPRADHQYPFDCYYYLPINERCIAGKSLVFALQSDANLVNEIYQMMIDANKLNIFPPIISTGTDKLGVDVMVPGLSLSLAEKDVQINPIRAVNDNAIQTAIDVGGKVEASLSESSQDPIQQGQQPGGSPSTAYEISRIETNAATVLGLSLKFMAEAHIIPYGKLLMSDILQYMTIGEVKDLTGDPGLVYKSFYVQEPGRTDKRNKIDFESTLPDTMTDTEKRDMSYKLLESQGGIKSSTTLWKVNPVLFRKNKYIFTIDADVMNPRSADLERAYAVELFDRAIAHPEVFDPKEIGKLFLETDPKARKDVERYLAKPMPAQPQVAMQGQTPNPPVMGNKLPQNFTK